MPDEPVPEAPADALSFLIADPCANKAFLTHLALSCMTSDTAHVTIVTRNTDFHHAAGEGLHDIVVCSDGLALATGDGFTDAIAKVSSDGRTAIVGLCDGENDQEARNALLCAGAHVVLDRADLSPDPLRAAINVALGFVGRELPKKRTLAKPVVTEV